MTRIDQERRVRLGTSSRGVLLPALLPALLLALHLPLAPARAASVAVRVLDARDLSPITGAFVQVGPAPGLPFAGNSGLTGPDGRITFSDGAISGPQTVTAGADGFALFSVMDAVVDSVTLRLTRELPEGSALGPTAEVSGTVTNIATQNNDGNLDLAFVYPAVRLADLLGERNLPIEVPADTVNFPVIGPTVLPGNVVLPSQVEFLFFTFSKPSYHFSIGDAAIYDFIALAGRVPIDALTLPLEEVLNAVTFREVGVERQIAVNGPRTLNINSDLDLSHNLTVNVPEAPNGSSITVASVADLPSPAGLHTLFLDGKTGLADTQDSFLLSGKNPSGDMSDAVPYLAGTYADSSIADLFSAGRVDRSSLVLPATRTLGGFFALPDLSQAGAQFLWSDVSHPGSSPTWALASFRVEPSDAADSTVTVRSIWQVAAPASPRSFVLPVLAPGAPGGIPDLGQTPDADQLVWDHLLADPAGALQGVLDDPLSSASRFSRRKLPVTPPVTAVEHSGAPRGAAELSFRVGPNPVGRSARLHWSMPMPAGTPVAWRLAQADGRRVAGGELRVSGGESDALPSIEGLSAGVYWLRMSQSTRTGVVQLVVGSR